LVIACGDDAQAPNEVTTEDLAGIWDLIGLELRSTDDPPQVVELTDEGITGTFTISPDGCYVLSLVVEDSEPGIQSGTLRVAGSELWVAGGDCQPGSDFPDDRNVLTFTYGGDTFSMSGDGVVWDFDDDGENEPAVQTFTFRRSD
jgi:hypothetical protein